MSDACKTEQVMLQENGIIRDKSGIIIGRLIATSELDKLREDLNYAINHVAKLTDFAIWMTGCCEMTQYEYFIKNRYLLSEPPIFTEDPSTNKQSD